MALHFERAFARDKDDRGKITNTSLQRALLELARLGAVEVANGMAVMSLVGQEMKNMVGASGKMLKAPPGKSFTRVS